MKKGIFLILLFLLQFCTENQERFWFLNEKPENKERIISAFSNYIEHFPLKDDFADTKYSWILNPETEYNLTFYAKGLSKSIINDCIDKNKEQIIATYPANKDCLLVLNRFANKENHGILKDEIFKDSLINRDCYQTLYPIPNFWQSDFYCETSQCHLPDDFTIYVFESKSGVFIESKNLSKGRYMPEKWKNGYSKGIAISEEKEVIIYWVIIW